MNTESTKPQAHLQLRWEADSERGGWLCQYELVIPLGEFDIRREVWEDGEQVGTRNCLVVPLNGPTHRRGNGTPCMDRGKHYFDTPFRDGAHAMWDAKFLGDLPIYAIAPDGTRIEKDTP